MQLQLPKPCHEHWGHMTPQAQGRFCQSCQQTVTDFTGMTDLEIWQVLKTQTGVCGRFRSGQLNRNLEVPRPAATPAVSHKTWLPVWPLAAMFILCVPVAGTVAAPRPPLVQQVSVPQVPRQTDSSTVLHGRVVDGKGEALQGVTVTVGKQSVLTNSGGYFTLAPAAPLPRHFKLEVRFVGYETRTIRVKDGRVPDCIVLKAEEFVLMGAVAVVE